VVDLVCVPHGRLYAHLTAPGEVIESLLFHPVVLPELFLPGSGLQLSKVAGYVWNLKLFKTYPQNIVEVYCVISPCLFCVILGAIMLEVS
jgi:hypothetical protein